MESLRPLVASSGDTTLCSSLKGASSGKSAERVNVVKF
jgi:hypothetical protein